MLKSVALVALGLLLLNGMSGVLAASDTDRRSPLSPKGSKLGSDSQLDSSGQLKAGPALTPAKPKQAAPTKPELAAKIPAPSPQGPNIDLPGQLKVSASQSGIELSKPGFDVAGTTPMHLIPTPVSPVSADIARAALPYAVSADIQREIQNLHAPVDLRKPDGAFDAVRKGLVQFETAKDQYGVLYAAQTKEYEAALKSLGEARTAADAGDTVRAGNLLGQARRFEIRMGKFGSLGGYAYSGQVADGYQPFINQLKLASTIIEPVGGAYGRAGGFTLVAVAAVLQSILDSESATRGTDDGRMMSSFAETMATDLAKKLLLQAAKKGLPLREVWDIAKVVQAGWKAKGGADLGREISESISAAEAKVATTRIEKSQAGLELSQKGSKLGSGGQLGSVIALRDKARQEFQRDMRFEGREERMALGLKMDDLVVNKTAIDAHGNRVRIEGYILRPQPNQVQQLVLNTRDDRFDYAYTLATFFQPISGIAEARQVVSATFGGVAAPANYLTGYEMVASNTSDRVSYTLVLGAPLALDLGATIGARYFPSTLSSKLRLAGPDYDVVKEDIDWVQDGTQFTFTAKYPDAGGALATYVSGTYTPSTQVCSACTVDNTVAPALSSSLAPDGSLQTTLTFKDGTYFGYDTWNVKNDGTIVPPGSLSSAVQDPSVASKDLNLEVRFRATEFSKGKDKDIDVVLPSEMLQTSADGSRGWW